VNRRDALVVLLDPAVLARHVARWMTDLACAKDGDFAVALSGGSTPRALYQLLASEFANEFPWQRVDWFWGDERFVPQNDPQSNYRMVREAMLSHAPASRVHPVLINGLTATQSAAAYERELKSFYGANKLDPARPLFDLVLLGLGTDGHTASLFPGSAALDEKDHWTADVETQNLARITLTYPALESAAHVVFLVIGADKRQPLRGLLDRDHTLPAARLEPTGDLHIFADRVAAG
jgi:6-phosphogluconolactonase